MKLSLSFLAYLDPHDPLVVFNETLQEYKQSLSTSMKFNQTVMLFDEFSEFNHYKDSIDIKPICTYTVCDNYIDEMNVTLDSNLEDRLSFMMNAIKNNSNETWQATITSIEVQYLTELLHLLFHVSRQEMIYYSSSLINHVANRGKRQMGLYWI